MKADIERGKVHQFADIFEPQVSRVDSLVDHHARIVAEFPIELARRRRPRRARAHAPRCKQAIRESAGGRSDVQAHPPGTPRWRIHPARLRALCRRGPHKALYRDFDAAGNFDGVARLQRFLAVDQHFARHDQRLRFFAGLGQTALDQQAIEALLHEFRWTIRSASSRRRLCARAEQSQSFLRALRARAPPCAGIRSSP